MGEGKLQVSVDLVREIRARSARIQARAASAYPSRLGTAPLPCPITTTTATTTTTSSAAMLRLAARRCLRPTTISSSLRSPKTNTRRAISTTARRAADPWLLPNMPGHLEKATSPPDAPAPEPLPRPGESVETMRARLVYQSRKRGTLESDLLLSTFARERLGEMSEEELHEFDKVCFFFFASPTRARGEEGDG